MDTRGLGILLLKPVSTDLHGKVFPPQVLLIPGFGGWCPCLPREEVCSQLIFYLSRVARRGKCSTAWRQQFMNTMSHKLRSFKAETLQVALSVTELWFAWVFKLE